MIKNSKSLDEISKSSDTNPFSVLTEKVRFVLLSIEANGKLAARHL